MKYILIFIFSIVISATTSFAQLSDKTADKAVKSYLISLNYSNPGIVESAIENIMVLKLYYPERDYSQIIQKLDELRLTNTQKNIRVKAFIAANYLKYPQQSNLGTKNSHKVAIKKLLDSVDSNWQV